MRDYRFIPSTVGLILVVILVPAFVMLGFWQLDRAHQRETLNRMQDERLQEPALVIGPDESADLDAIRYREVILEGEFDREHQFLVDNQLEGQSAGYHVLVPFRLEGSHRSILINRGWVALGADRSKRPDVGGFPKAESKSEGVPITFTGSDSSWRVLRFLRRVGPLSFKSPNLALYPSGLVIPWRAFKYY